MTPLNKIKIDDKTMYKGVKVKQYLKKALLKQTEEIIKEIDNTIFPCCESEGYFECEKTKRIKQELRQKIIGNNHKPENLSSNQQVAGVGGRQVNKRGITNCPQEEPDESISGSSQEDTTQKKEMGK